ncbi:hypothetical protein OEB99_01900 [Actinotalea sp. M2MS4P-6]|uniref:hypothetical protein n=1 Tax=Actinotalea sp. M2MS4P-6 TaxID=2983762 RepID=UPI0021E4A665|nr:hypothetical protein [Actinotalea sp. M2MS4P-6]MCV2393050.1 hypothetical protein [Actinotalea sp. M2MS4P-6]
MGGIAWLAVAVPDLPSGSGFAWLMCVGAGFLLALSALMVRGALVPAVLTATAVATPRPVRGWTVVPLARVSGVGLRFHSGGNARNSRWVLWVWTDSGEPVAIKAAPPSRSAPPGQGKVLHSWTNYVPPLDWDYLAGGPSGTAAIAVNEAVLAAQGPDGLLARERRESDSSTAGDLQTAYWSPNGQIGPLVNVRGLGRT